MYNLVCACEVVLRALYGNVCLSACVWGFVPYPVCVRVCARARGQLGISVVLTAACPHVLSFPVHSFISLSLSLSLIHLRVSPLLSCHVAHHHLSAQCFHWTFVCPPTLAALFTVPPRFILWGCVEAFVAPQPFSQPRGSSERPGGLFEERDPWGTEKYGEDRDVVLSPES